MFAGCPGESDVTGTNVPVTGITLNKTNFALRVDTTEQLIATVEPATATDKAVIWSSSNESGATVDQDGLVNALSVGSVTITATTKDGNFFATCSILVTTAVPVPVESVAITGGSSVVVDTELNLTAAITPANPSIRNVTWLSSDESIATVRWTGTGQAAVVTGVAAGTVTITAYAADNKTATHGVTVTAETVAVTGVSLNHPSAELTAGQTLLLTATVAPATATNSAINWSSSFPSIASVSGGLVRAVANGEAVITVTTDDGGYTATCAITVTGGEEPRNYTKIEGETLVHYTPILSGVNHFGNDLGTSNPDGSYTFDGTAASWSGGGAQYNFPAPEGTGDTWLLSDYDLVEMHLSITDGSVSVGVKKSGGNVDLRPYPDATNYITLNSTTNGGKVTYTFVIGEAGAGIGFQRNNNGPATVAIEKVVFSKGNIRTITFSGGEYTAMPAIDPIKIPNGRTVNFGSSYPMPERPEWAGHDFVRWYNTTDSVNFNLSSAITKDITLTALWVLEGQAERVDMKLNLDPSTWGTLPAVPSGLIGNTGNDPYPTPANVPKDYAATSYANDVLTITFDGRNRQRAIIPLSPVQVDELLSAQGGVTFRIVGETKNTDGTVSTAMFRCHLVDANAGGSWNGTDTVADTVLTNLVQYASFSGNKSAATLGWFAMQAMFVDADGSPNSANYNETTPGFPGVVVTITSITIDIGNTTN